MPFGPERGPLKPRQRYILWAILGVGLALRLLWVLWLHPPGHYIYSDMNSYVDRARALMAHRYGEFDWMYPPGTGAFLAIGMWLVPHHWELFDGLLQTALSTLEIWLVFVGARRWFGATVALVAAGGFALHYLSIDFCGLFMSENYLTLGLALSFALFDPDDAPMTGFSGLAMGLGALAKPQVMLLAPLWFFLLVFRRRWAAAAALTVACSAVVLPASWAATRANEGRPTLLSSMGGIVMVQAWCPIKAVVAKGPGWTMMFGMPVVGERNNRGEPEGTWGEAVYDVPFTHSGYYTKVAIEQCIKRYPKFALKTFFRTQLDTFAGPPWSVEGPFPDAYTEYRTSIMAYNLAFSWLIVPLGFFAMWRFRKDPGMNAAVWLPVLSCLINSALLHGEPRLRIPYDLYWIVGAAVTLVWLVQRWRARHAPPEPVAEAVAPSVAEPAPAP